MTCHTPPTDVPVNKDGSIVLIGQPNVGKSVLFNHLTGQRVTVANYPGTTVEVAQGTVKQLNNARILDTPGVITMPAQTLDEQVTTRVLLEEDLSAVIQVGDAKNLRKTLLLTSQLAEMELPLVLALNMKDEADELGVKIDLTSLNTTLNFPVILTTAVKGRGLKEVQNAASTASRISLNLDYGKTIEDGINQVSELLPVSPISKRSMSLLWLSNDVVAANWLHERLGEDTYQRLLSIRESMLIEGEESLGNTILNVRIEWAKQTSEKCMEDAGKRKRTISESLGDISTHPVFGFPILVLILLGMYYFVGVFGAGTLVDLLETRLFGEIINPWFVNAVNSFIPSTFIQDLLVGDYGLWTMGMTYALALILPIVSTFFITFSLLEDSGYLPRLAALTNRVFSAIGLNGKAVLPMILGLGCVTMATLTTRVLEKKRERLLVTLLLALAVPCSAQLGIIMGMLAGLSLSATIIWSGVVFGVMLAVGWLTARVLPGERSTLLVELPPIRKPSISSVLIKTGARLEWYLKEIIPLFLLGAVIMFALDKSGMLTWLIGVGEPLVTDWLGLPKEASAAFIMGFIRRDFGASGLFTMQAQGLLSSVQVIVSMVTITLFIPCIASVMVIGREHGWKIATSITVTVIPLAFFVGGVLNFLLNLTGIFG